MLEEGDIIGNHTINKIKNADDENYKWRLALHLMIMRMVIMSNFDQIAISVFQSEYELFYLLQYYLVGF